MAPILSLYYRREFFYLPSLLQILACPAPPPIKHNMVRNPIPNGRKLRNHRPFRRGKTRIMPRNRDIPQIGRKQNIASKKIRFICHLRPFRILLIQVGGVGEGRWHRYPRKAGENDRVLDLWFTLTKVSHSQNYVPVLPTSFLPQFRAQLNR